MEVYTQRKGRSKNPKSKGKAKVIQQINCKLGDRTFRETGTKEASSLTQVIWEVFPASRQTSWKETKRWRIRSVLYYRNQAQVPRVQQPRTLRMKKLRPRPSLWLLSIIPRVETCNLATTIQLVTQLQKRNSYFRGIKVTTHLQNKIQKAVSSCLIPFNLLPPWHSMPFLRCNRNSRSTFLSIKFCPILSQPNIQLNHHPWSLPTLPTRIRGLSETIMKIACQSYWI